MFFNFFNNQTKRTFIRFSIFQFKVLKQHPLPREAEVLFKVRDNGSCIKRSLNFIFLHNDVFCLVVMFFFCWLCFVLFFWLVFSRCIFSCIGTTTRISVVIPLVLLLMLALLFTMVLNVASFALVFFSSHVIAFPHSIPHIGVVFFVCSYFSLHCFVVTLHCIMLMFFSHVVATFCTLVSRLFLHWCSTLNMLVVGMPFFFRCYVVILTLLHYFSHTIMLLYLCCFFCIAFVVLLVLPFFSC